MTEGHLDDDELVVLALDEVAGPDRARLVRHLSVCSRCRVEYDALSATVEDTLSAAGYVHERLGRLRRERDVVLVDQRGTGRSAVLRCRLHDPANPAPSLQHLMPPEPVARCARELSQHADLTQYSYLHFARDLEAVRKALGYGRLNLSAGSYGTRAAQVFLRAYPESVRTAFLGSVVPMDVVTPLTMAKSSQPIFEATIDACAGEPACRAAFPRHLEPGDRSGRMERGLGPGLVGRQRPARRSRERARSLLGRSARTGDVDRRLRSLRQLPRGPVGLQQGTSLRAGADRSSRLRPAGRGERAHHLGSPLSVSQDRSQTCSRARRPGLLR